MSTNASPAIEEMIDFMLRGKDPNDIMNWRASREANERLSNLIEKEHGGTITEQERLELDNQMFLEHIATLMKARTMQALASRNSSSGVSS